MRRIGKVITVVLALILASSCFAACGDDYGGRTLIKFWGTATEEEAEALQAVVDNYNKNNTDNIYLQYEPQPDSSYTDKIDRALAGTSGPDIFYVSERVIKRWAKLGYLENLQSRIDNAGIDLDGMWHSAVQRYRYDPVNNTNNADDDLYCMPKDISPTLIYYNKTVMEEQGIVVISVDEDKLDAFNHEGARDNVGKTKADYGITGDVQKKGFYRENPYNGLNWAKPVYGSNGKVLETMIFNNRIAMSWDEIEDLAMILTKAANPGLVDARNKMEWGYFTECWFNYGWGVGGDCAVDTTGEGDWVFTLGDTKHKCVLYNADGSYAYNDSRQNIFVDSDKTSTYPLSDGQYFGNPLPSQREALDRFVNISRSDNDRGVAITPTPKQIGTSTALSFFAQGRVGMVVQQNYLITSLRRTVGDSFEWDVCPLPVYKEYENIKGDKVKTQGVNIGHSGTQGFGIWTGSKHKDEAFKVIEYLACGEGQIVMANLGFTMCNQRDLVQKEYVDAQVAKGLSPRNIQVAAEYGDVQRPGDWWYMPDAAWIDDWAGYLNGDVRNGGMTVDRMFELVTDSTNAKLKAYKNSK